MSKMSAADLEYLAEQGVMCEYGGHTLAFLRQADQVLVSPGIPQDIEVLRQLRGVSIPVLGELAAASLIKKPIVAITGTNGKTTVTALIVSCCRRLGKRFLSAGISALRSLIIYCAQMVSMSWFWNFRLSVGGSRGF